MVGSSFVTSMVDGGVGLSCVKSATVGFELFSSEISPFDDVVMLPPLDIKYWVTEPYYDDTDKYRAEQNGTDDVFETEIVLILNHTLASVIVDESEDSEDDSKLWNADTTVPESVDNRPRMAEPGNFSEDEATD